MLSSHDGLRNGEEVAAARIPALTAAFHQASAPGAQFSLKYVRPHQEAEYEDPVRGFEGKWLAAFAPVGGTGYVMAVQSPRPDLLHALRRFITRFFERLEEQPSRPVPKTMSPLDRQT